jgi:NADH:ubiquinone oxidoreductase subunit 4 (subunit M)
VAYTTVQEMNVLLLVFLLSFEYQFEVLNSFLLFHGILSVFLFYVVELIQKQTSTRSIFKLGGLGEYLPSMAPFL